MFSLFAPLSIRKKEKDKVKKHVVIWGDDHHNALGLLRMLGGRDYDILLIVSNKKNIATASKYCTKFVEISNLDDGLKFLFANYKDKNNKAVLLFTADKYSEFANKHLFALADFFYVCGPTDEGSLESIDDKYIMGELASSFGFIVPKSLLLSGDNDIPVEQFPVIIKPCRPISKDFKTLIANNINELRRIKKRLDPEKRYILQEYIQKEADCLVYGCRTMQNETIIAGACVRNRWSDDGCGSFGYITPDLPNGINEASISAFLSKIQFHGLFSVEYGLKNDKAYFYEFNLRNDGTSHLFYQAGANIALAFVESCFSCETKENTRAQSKQYLINEIWDKFNISNNVISRKEYKDDFNRSSIFFYYDPNDIEPYNIQKSKRTWLGIRRIISKSVINKIRLQIKSKMRRKKYHNESNNKCR